jgi:ATP-binding cassette subfamily B protein
VLDDTVTFGLLVAFIEYVQKFFIPIRDMSVKYMAMQQAMAASERVFELIDNNEIDGLPKSVDSCAGEAERMKTKAPPEHIAFEDIHFAYQPDQPVLKGVSCAVRQGQSLAVVGATGSGKSTLIRLLSRFYHAQKGTIWLAGTDICSLDLNQLRDRIVVVNQDVFLFSGTVADNISLGDPQISREQITKAAERVGLTRILDLERDVQERGSNLSAGERQLVAFTRALVRDPEVLVLDEATANIDPKSEQLIQQGVAELMRERTAIVIAHRLTTIERVDQIIVLHHGQVVEQGSHDELLARQGIYHQLYQLQYVAE